MGRRVMLSPSFSICRTVPGRNCNFSPEGWKERCGPLLSTARFAGTVPSQNGLNPLQMAIAGPLLLVASGTELVGKQEHARSHQQIGGRFGDWRRGFVGLL